MSKMDKAAGSKVALPALFICVCAVAFLFVRQNTHEWGYKYTDQIKQNPSQAEWYYFRGCRREFELYMGRDAAGYPETISEETRKERGKMVLDDFSKVIELAPEFGTAYYHRAKCKSTHGLGDPGPDLEKACQLVPNDAQSHLEYSRYLEQSGQQEKAAEQQKIAEQLQRN